MEQSFKRIPNTWKMVLWNKDSSREGLSKVKSWRVAVTVECQHFLNINLLKHITAHDFGTKES